MPLKKSISQNSPAAEAGADQQQTSVNARRPRGERCQDPTFIELKKAASKLPRHFPEGGMELKRSLLQVATTGAAFFAMLALMAVVSGTMYWLTLLLAIPTAGLLVRLFIVQHDCGHGSYFKLKSSNDILGNMISVLTLTPYGNWSRSHAAHHATSGNLDRRGRGDVITMTVEEYQELSPLGRLGYRLFRNPIIMNFIGAPVNFIILQRLPTGRSWRNRDDRNSILALNLALVVVFGIPMVLFGVGKVLSIYVPMMTIAAWAGGWLFYVQHQFEGTCWERDENWDFHSASVIGSSYFELPPLLRWFTGSIGLHHIHHLCSRIPNYRLQAIHEAFPEISSMAHRLNMVQSLKCWRLALWDEKNNKLIGFSDLKHQAVS